MNTRLDVDLRELQATLAKLEIALSCPVVDEGPWTMAPYGKKTIGVGVAGGPALLMVRPGDIVDMELAREAVASLLVCRNHARALVEYVRELSARAHL